MEAEEERLPVDGLLQAGVEADGSSIASNRWP
jgi:hypothetical protein